MDVTETWVSQDHSEGTITLVTALFATLVLTAAVAAAVGLGILFAWVVMVGIFSVFGRTTRPVKADRPRLVLVATEAHASGD